MTDRFHSLTVVLEKDMRDDDAKSLQEAISHLRGVCMVTGNTSSWVHVVARWASRPPPSSEARDRLIWLLQNWHADVDWKARKPPSTERG
jgi:hypothetical protein